MGEPIWAVGRTVSYSPFLIRSLLEWSAIEPLDVSAGQDVSIFAGPLNPDDCSSSDEECRVDRAPAV